MARPIGSSRRARSLVAAVVASLCAGCALGAPGPAPIATPLPRVTFGRPTPSAPPAVVPAGELTPSPAPTSGITPTPAPGGYATGERLAACLATARRLTPDERAAQVVMAGLRLTAPVGAPLIALANRGIGGIVLDRQSAMSATQIRAMITALPAPHGLLVTVDQEGGTVQRLIGPGFDRIPSAQVQATMTDGRLRAAWAIWGAQLKAAGVDVNLAPVADVVPPEYAAVNQPISLLGRGFGPDAAVVSAKVGAVVLGLHDALEGAVLKHYPGLGRTTLNTDFAPAFDTQTTLADPNLAVYWDQAAAAEMIMVSTVVYTRIDASRPAALVSAVHASIRRLGFTGVIVSDDLGGTGAVRNLSPAQVAVDYLAAGGDLITTVGPAYAPAMIDAIAARAASDPAFAEQLALHDARVLALKQAYGLVTCG